MPKIIAQCVLIVSLFSVPLVFVSPLSASAAPSRRERERAAQKACLNGQYETGVDILSELFIDTHAPNYLFNQGRCFEQNRRFEEAIGRFEEYLRAAENSAQPVPKKDKAEAETHIAKCKVLLAEQLATKQGANNVEPPPTATLPPQPVPAPPTIVVPEPKDSPMVVETNSAKSNTQEPGSGLRTTGVVMVAAGAVAGAVGLVFNLRANSLALDIENKVGGYTSTSLSQQRNNQTLAWVGYGTGAACLATGVVLYLLGANKANSGTSMGTSTLALAPLVNLDQTGFVLAGAF